MATELSTILVKIGEALVVGLFMVLMLKLGSLLFGGLDNLLDRYFIPETKWVKLRETSDSIIYADSTNNDDPKSTHSSGYKVVDKKEDKNMDMEQAMALDWKETGEVYCPTLEIVEWWIKLIGGEVGLDIDVEKTPNGYVVYKL